jgi:uncharacterized membrane protein
MEDAFEIELRVNPVVPILAIQFALLSLIGLQNLGIAIPVVRQVIGTIYLVFIPGLLILLVLNVRNLDFLEGLLYSVGLSLAAIMVTGLALNAFGPILGIQHPLSATPLVAAMAAVTLSLCAIWYFKSTERVHPFVIRISRPAVPPALLLCLVPFLSIFGAYLLNFFEIPALLILLVITVALLVILAGFGKVISKDLYPLALFVIAISLLYHVSLVSTYLTGYDVQIEYNVARLVVSNGYWNTAIANNVNAMLGIVVIAPTFSQICSIDLVWVYKAIYPLLFALVPVGLFRIFQKQTDDKTAFLSAFLVTSIFAFYAVMPQLARVEIAELFVVLLILVAIDQRMLGVQRTAFFIVFSFALITSHYGLSYIFMFVLVAAWVVGLLFSAPSTGKVRGPPSALLKRSDGTKTSESAAARQMRTRVIRPSTVLLFILLAFTWYKLASGGSSVQLLVNIARQVTENIGTTLFNPASRDVINAATTQLTPMREITRYLTLGTQFFIAIGLASIVLNRRKWRFDDQFLAFAIGFFLVNVASVVVPNIATFLTFRFYQITLLITAPFFVVGWLAACRFLFCNVLTTRWTTRRQDAALSGVAVFLAIFLAFNSGLVYELAHDRPAAMSYNPNVDAARFNEKELTGATWLLSQVANRTVLSSDVTGGLLLQGKDPVLLYVGQDNQNKRLKSFFADTEELPQGSPIFLRSHVIETGQILDTYQGTEYKSLNSSIFYRAVLSKTSKVYDNGGSQIYV